MIFIFGDSHANFCMANFNRSNTNLYQNSITMHRVGRDGIIPKFCQLFNHSDSIFLFFYGEIDCRCHIDRQLKLDRKLDEIIDTLTTEYIKTINQNIHTFKKIIICSITPPLRKHECEDVHGPVKHEFPFLGTDSERTLYTKLMNESLKNKIKDLNNFIFFDFTEFYSRDDGTLKYELSDGICHIKENQYILDSIEKIIL